MADVTTNQIIEKIFYTYLNNKQYLLAEKKDLMLKITSDAILSDLNALTEQGELRKVEPTDSRVQEVYFGSVDISRFSREDLENATRDIQVTLDVWEENRANVEDK
jgi:hypothetical protein